VVAGLIRRRLVTTDARGQMERFRQHLARKGLKLTVQRKAIAEVFFAGDRHLSLLELLERAQGRRRGIGYATVYRTMRLLTEGGLAIEHKFGENQARYEPGSEGEHHDHLICVDCGVIVEYEDATIEALQERVARDHGFEVVSHRHEIYVRCRPGSCRRVAVG